MFRSLFTIIALVAASANAFSMSPASLKPVLTSTTALNAVMTLEEIEAIIQKGHECEESECSLSDVNDLIDTLQEQQHILYERLQGVNKMVESLSILNEASDRQEDEVRETVRAIFRIFAMSAKASGNAKATGYSGEVGDGPTDAYKALNPKPWKASP